MNKSIFRYVKGGSVTKREDIPFKIGNSGLFIIAVTARCKGEKQINQTDDQDLRVEIDGRKFPQLTNSTRYFDSPAAFSGGELHSLKETIYFILLLEKGEKGEHVVSVIPDTPEGILELVEVFQLDTQSKVEMNLNIQAEDGNNYPWIMFVLVDLPLISLTTQFILQRRVRDSDEVKIIIDGKIERNFSSIIHKFWYFVASLFQGESNAPSRPLFQAHTFNPNLSKGLHYIEFWADRMPTISLVSLALESVINREVLRKYKDEIYNHLDQYIINSTKHWNDFFSAQDDPPLLLLDPNVVKAMLYRESKIGTYSKNSGSTDVMQVWDSDNPAAKTIKGQVGYNANEFQDRIKIDHMSYSYKNKVLPGEAITPEESIFFGIRWLYHKAQKLNSNTPPFHRQWLSWEEAVMNYNGNKDLKEAYMKEVFSIVNTGIDAKGIQLWQK